MPLTLNVNVSKKIGQPDYGSLGASCRVEVELDAGLITGDLDLFQQRVRQAYAACFEAGACSASGLLRVPCQQVPGAYSASRRPA